MSNELGGCFYMLGVILVIMTVGISASWLILYLASLAVPAIQATLWNAVILFGILWIIKAIIS